MDSRRNRLVAGLVRALEPLRTHPLLAAAVVIGLLVIIAFFDLYTGTRVNVDLLYLIPILLATVAQGAQWGLAAALLSTLAELLYNSDVLQGRITGFDLWNSAIALATFVLSVLLVYSLARDRQRLRSNEEQLRRSYDEATRLAETDGLTGVHNLRFLQHWFDSPPAHARLGSAPTSVLMFDVDNLKGINDEHGHATGSEVLVRLAAILTKELRQSDIVARTGGDEFVAILPRTDASIAKAVANRVHAQICAQLPQTMHINVSVSIGVAPLVQQARPVGEMLELADRAMYRAKELGKNQVFEIIDSSQPVSGLSQEGDPPNPEARSQRA